MDYAAPEMLEGTRYAGPPQDMWALGILLYTLLFRENPFRSVDEILAGGPLRLPYRPSGPALALMLALLARDPARRPTIDTVLRHPYFTPAPTDF
jgi:serine/threonine protein kinase